MYNLIRRQSRTKLYTIKDANTPAEHFQNVMSTIISQTVSVKNIFKKAGYPVWFNKEIIKNLKRKYALRKNLKKNPRTSTTNTVKFGNTQKS